VSIRTVLFDHDDTLLPTFEVRARVLGEAAREVLGRELDGAAVLAASNGRNLEQMSEDLTDGDAALAATLVAAYRERYYVANQQGLTPYPGIIALLECLRDGGVRMAVVTSKLGSGAREELERTGIAPFMEALVGAEDVPRHKPDPAPFRRVFQLMGGDPQPALMVGDTAADILGARNAGLASVAALWGARDRDGLLALEPDHTAESPQDILDLLQVADGAG
jgi:HAD superfamily hydrolase (TIGR01549 family)